jgi:integrase
MGKRQSAGEGSVYQRQSDGRWVVQFRDLQGRTRHRYRDPRGRRLENKTHARQALRAYLQQRGEGVGGDDPRLAEWTAWWLAQLDLRPTTIADYRYKIGLLPDWLMRKRLAQITPMDVHEALAELASSETVHGKPRAGSTVAQVRTVLGNCLHVAERYGHVTRNAARLAAPVAYQHAEVDPLDVGEARALLKQVDGHRLGSLFTVALSLGLRQGECVGLEWSDVDLEAGTLSVMRQITRTNEHVEAEGTPKTRRSRRSLILPRVCVDQLLRHRRLQEAERAEADEWGDSEWIDRDLVWPSTRGTPLSPSNLRRLLRRQCELAGIRQVTFHTLRHSAATLLLAQGVPSAVILDVLGHQDVRMLRRYQHVTDSLRQDAADAIDRSFAVKPTVKV